MSAPFAPVDLDLFAGAGGLAVGLKDAGFSPVDLYELDEIACKTLQHNTHTTLVGNVQVLDVTEVNWSKSHRTVRLLAAGAPCQPFSLGGKHRSHTDERNLFPEVIRAVRELHPQAVLIENVRGLLRSEFQKYFEYILRQLECPSIRQRNGESWREHDQRIRRHQCSTRYAPEYQVAWRLLEAADYGVPQLRKRIFIVATRSDLPLFRFPSATHSAEVLTAMQLTGEYWELHDLEPPKRHRGKQSTPYERHSFLPWRTVRDGLAGLPKPAQNEESSVMNHWLIPGARSYTGHEGSKLDWPSKTIKAGVHGVPGGENTVITDDRKVRYYTLREAARLQTFPDEHFFTGARIHVTRQLGNAVPCQLAATVARPLMELLRTAEKISGSAK